MKDRLSELTEAEIAFRLQNARQGENNSERPVSPYPPEFLPKSPRPAAVLIPFLRRKGEWHLLFIRRTQNQYDRHSGQVAFPGGSADPGDNGPESTALREAREEIGLKPEDVHILGRLNDFLTITNYRVTPVVGVIPWPFSLHLERSEVSRSFTIPLAWLADPAHHEERQRVLPPPYDPIPVIYFQPYEGEILWGASARFTVSLLEILFGKK